MLRTIQKQHNVQGLEQIDINDIDVNSVALFWRFVVQDQNFSYLKYMFSSLIFSILIVWSVWT